MLFIYWFRESKCKSIDTHIFERSHMLTLYWNKTWWLSLQPLAFQIKVRITIHKERLQYFTLQSQISEFISQVETPLPKKWHGAPLIYQYLWDQMLPKIYIQIHSNFSNKDKIYHKIPLNSLWFYFWFIKAWNEFWGHYAGAA